MKFSVVAKFSKLLNLQIQ